MSGLVIANFFFILKIVMALRREGGEEEWT